MKIFVIDVQSQDGFMLGTVLVLSRCLQAVKRVLYIFPYQILKKRSTLSSAQHKSKSLHREGTFTTAMRPIKCDIMTNIHSNVSRGGGSFHHLRYIAASITP